MSTGIPSNLEAAYDVLAGPTEVSVTTTTATLAALLAAASPAGALDDGLHVLTLIIQGAGVAWANGAAAVAATNDLSAGTHELRIQADNAALLQFICASGTVKMSVVQEGVQA